MTKSTVRLNHVRVGFEAECIIDKRKLSAHNLTPDSALSIAVGPESTISSHLGKGKQHSGVNYAVWNLMDDDTIIVPNTHSIGVEVISPVLDYLAFSSALDSTFSYIESFGSTDASCGLHLGVSLDGVSLAENLDILKLILFLGEAHIASSFERFDNDYAKRIEPYVATYLSSFHDIEDHIKEIVTRPLYPVTPSVQSVIPWDKFFSLNFTKIESNNYIEFRLIGGKDYHTRTKEILAIARRLSWAVSIACDPNAYKNEYATKLLKFAHSSKSSVDRSVNIKLVPTGAGSYNVDIGAPGAIGDVHALSLRTVRHPSGTYGIVSSSDDSLRSAYRDGLYVALTEGVGGALRLSIDPNAEREVAWICDDLVEAVTNPQRLLYLITACPSLLPILSKDSTAKLMGLARDQVTRGAIIRALSKCWINSVFRSYIQLGIVPVTETPNLIASNAQFAQFDLSSLFNTASLQSPDEMRSLLLSMSCRGGSVAHILKAVVSATQEPLVVAQPEDTAELVVSLCNTDNYHGAERADIVDALSKLMRHSPASENRFLFNLFEAGVVYNNQFLLGLAETLSHKNVDKSWTSCLQVM